MWSKLPGIIYRVELAPEARLRIIQAQLWVDDIVASKKAV